MSWFDDEFRANCVPILFDHLASDVTVTYTAASGEETELQGILTNQGKEGQVDPMGRRVRRARELVVTTDPNSHWGGITTPDTKATVTIEGEVWSVESVESHSDNLIRLTLVQLPLKERTRQGFRKE